MISSKSEPVPSRRQPSKILIPVPSLTVPEAWRVGRVIFHPSKSARGLITDAPPFDSQGGWLTQAVFEVLDSSATGSIAEVPEASDIHEALEALRSSLSVLRLFQASRRSWTETTFGVGADVGTAVIRYVSIWERSAPGATVEGHFTGYTFEREALDDWGQSDAFQFLSEALVDQSDEGRKRAVRGTLLFDRAALEHRPDLRMLGFASALEAWFHGEERGPKKYRLARHVAWFGCGTHNGDLCGRARPICPYLHLRPTDQKRLLTLRGLGNTYTSWRCSEWHRVMDWYDARSAVAHGELNEVSKKEGDQPEFWISHYLAEPILLWLRDHPSDPTGELQRLLNSQPDPAGWRQCAAHWTPRHRRPNRQDPEPPRNALTRLVPDGPTVGGRPCGDRRYSGRIPQIAGRGRSCSAFHLSTAAEQIGTS
ncbi:MAG: hypothetical protein GY713_21365 [Actinomycetia bacterium]|nr:hypothetical protein [Actinomycetes bacterium]